MITPLTLADAADVQHLFERCSEFWELIEGAGVAEEEITAIAPGKTIEDTFSFGVYEGDRLIAFVGLARNYPKEPEWSLGLLLIDPAERNRGLGPRIHRELVDWVAAQGGTKLWIVVQTQNVAAERFWRRQGYVEQRRGTVIEMVRELTP